MPFVLRCVIFFLDFIKVWTFTLSFFPFVLWLEKPAQRLAHVDILMFDYWADKLCDLDKIIDYSFARGGAKLAAALHPFSCTHNKFSYMHKSDLLIYSKFYFYFGWEIID